MPLLLPLNPADEMRLLPLLAEQGSTILARQQLLDEAGLTALLPKIDLNTPAEQFASQALRAAQRWGELSPGVPALLPLLRQLRERYAGQAEAAAFLDTLLALPPTVADLPPDPDPPPSIQNQITGTTGDVMIANVVVEKGAAVAPDVTVGKNIIKIGRIVVPIWMFLAAIALPFLLSGGAYWLFVPAKMPNNAAQFNVAVADFGELRDGRVHPSEQARLLSRWVAEGLTAEKPVFQEAFGNPIEVWHDGLSPLAKRTPIGVIEGQNDRTRQANAEARANDLNANVLIYGVLEEGADGRAALSVEFYVKPDLSQPVETRLGHYRLGDPIPLPVDFNPADSGTGDSAVLWEQVTMRGRALAWLIRALDRERRGLREEMIEVLERAEDAEGSAETGRLRWREQGMGKEILYTLKGEAHLELAYADRSCGDESEQRAAFAESAFRQALNSNPDYAYAEIGMGNVAHLRAQCLLTVGAPDEQALDAAAPLLEEATEWYQSARLHAPAAPEPLYLATLADLALVPAYRLQALTALHRARLNPDASLEAYERAAAALDAGESTLAGALEELPADDHRLRAKAFLIEGNLAGTRALLLNLRGESAAYTDALQTAARAYEQCESEANDSFADVYLIETLVPQFCTPQKEATLCLMGQTAMCGGE